MMLIHGGLDQLMNLDGAFDRVFSVNVLQFSKDRNSVLRSLRSLLKPGGVLAMTHQPRHAGARPEDAAAFGERLRAAMHDAAFVNVRTEMLLLKPVPVVCVLGETRE